MARLAANNSNNKDEPLDRLLVVDDDPDILQLLKLALLKEKRVLVDAFTNPEEALQSFKANAKAYRLMLSDIRMPSISGIQLARKVKEINSNVKVVLITAFELGDNEFSEAFPSNKIDAFLQKPIGIGDLTNKVLSLL
jgi:DNA-binding NtrC family response regulator